MNDLERFFTEIDEYINYHIDKAFGNKIDKKPYSILNIALTTHIGRICLGAFMFLSGGIIRQYYEEKAYFDYKEMSLIQPTDAFYWLGFGLAAFGGFILVLYAIILFYNMAKNFFE